MEAQGRGSGGGTNPRPRSARNRRPSGAGGGAVWRAPWERVTVGWDRLALVGAQTVPASVHRLTRCIGVGSGYSLKLASIAATCSFSASMSCWFTSSIFCKSAREAFST